MARIEVGNTVISYEETGCGKQTMVFSHGLLMSSRMYEDQLRHFRGRYRCIAYDHRGQGSSAVADSGYDMDTIADDAAALIESLGGAPCHFVGLSMGGFVGMRLAARRPELLRSLVLIETSADPEPAASARRYRMLARIAGLVGFRPLAGRIMKILFGQTFLKDPARDEERKLWRERLIANNRHGTLRAARGVITREGVYGELGRIRTPTLILVGDEDIATPPSRAQRIHQAIDGSRLEQIPNAGHSSTIEEPVEVNRLMDTFLAGLDN